MPAFMIWAIAATGTFLLTITLMIVAETLYDDWASGLAFFIFLATIGFAAGSVFCYIDHVNYTNISGSLRKAYPTTVFKEIHTTEKNVIFTVDNKTCIANIERVDGTKYKHLINQDTIRCDIADPLAGKVTSQEQLDTAVKSK